MLRCVFWLLSLVLSGSVLAADAVDRSIPEPLQAWIPWVLHDVPDHDCPYLYAGDRRLCRWSGPLSLVLNEHGGNFAGQWTLYREDWLELPGDAQHWPQLVTVDGRPGLVMAHEGKPALLLPAGQYRLAGAWRWDALPEELALPDDTGPVELRIDNRPIAFPTLKEGALWLKRGDVGSPSTEQEADRLDLQVFRKILDDQPLQLSTYLELEVAGHARDIRLRHALLAGFIPVQLSSPLPARLESDGSLSLQVKPGRWHLELLARQAKPQSQLDFAVADPDWPAAEIWSFEAAPAIRLVAIDSSDAVDPSQNNVPPAWQALPAYRMAQGASLMLREIRRGDPQPQPNRLTIGRQFWLDFDGGGYTIQDTINGTMSRDWRLDATPDMQPGQALLDGQNQLLTELAGTGRSGLEIRQGALQLTVDSRWRGAIDRLDAVGWRQTFEHVEAELHLPPGWQLLAASGVDNVPDSWLARWTLLDVFWVLAAAVGFGRLYSRQWGTIALLTLALIWHEAAAPRWIWLHGMAAVALVAALPASGLLPWLKGYRNVCAITLATLVLPFMVQQVRSGFYPQLDVPASPIAMAAELVGSVMPAEAPLLAEQADALPNSRALQKSLAAPTPTAPPQTRFERIDPDAKLQTGPGVPQWQWRSVKLSWNGPVDDAAQIRLWYLSPAMSLLLNLCRVGLVALLGLKLFGVSWRGVRAALPVLAFLVLMPLPWMSQPAYAELPDAALLAQLKNRLLEPPRCLPACAQIPAMTLSDQGEVLTIRLDILAHTNTAVPLPAAREQWFPVRLELDGKALQGALSVADDVLWLNVGPGAHVVTLQGPYGEADRFTLPLPLTPQRTDVQLAGWRAVGVHENGRTDPQLEFTRLPTDNNGRNNTALRAAALPPFVRVERSLHLGLDWRVTTRVVQQAAGEAAAVLAVPLLPGEAITTAQVRVENGAVQVNLSPRQGEVMWQSMLPISDRLRLTAADTDLWSEVWRVEVGSIWHAAATGPVPSQHQNSAGQWLPEWHPRPGESLEWTISRPAALAGQTLTLDDSRLELTPGTRLQLAQLSLTLRSSQAGQHTIRLPEEAQLQTAAVDGLMQPIRQQGATVVLPIRPGTQNVALSWQQPTALSGLWRSPEVDLGVVGVNSRIRVVLPEDRWLLLTWGPTLGPAVLFWGMLAVAALVAFGLGKLRLTPLTGRDWFLLLIGLSSLEPVWALLVIGWLSALGWRAGQQPAARLYFNATQLGLALWTLLALAIVFRAVQQGLLGTPDRHVVGNDSTAFDLNWYQDRHAAQLPTVTLLSVPLTVYRAAMLAWSLWLAWALIRWLQWGWGCLAANGLWRSKPSPAP